MLQHYGTFWYIGEWSCSCNVYVILDMWGSITSVSYTHLDVYKRQVLKDKDYEFGHTKIFLKAKHDLQLEQSRDRMLEKSILLLQKNAKRWLYRKRLVGIPIYRRFDSYKPFMTSDTTWTELRIYLPPQCRVHEQNVFCLLYTSRCV